MRTTALIAIFVACSALVTAGSPPALPASPALPAQFRASSELVVLHVSVRDRRGRYISGLKKDAFTVIDDARPQTLEMFSADDVPASVGFLIDNSNSMRPSRERVIASAVAFAQHSHPQDEIFVLTFNEKVRSAYGPKVVQDMDTAGFARAMFDAIVARGMTAIYDGLAAGLSQLEQARHTRQVLIVVSDGGDNASQASRDEVVKRVRDSDATVYTVGLIDPLVRDGNPKLLRQLARATGGESYQPRRIDEVPEAFERIAMDIRNAYTLAYVPTTTHDGPERRRRAVKVYVRSQDGRPLNVRARDGYFEKTHGERQ
jgi:Ca-activated chloride channel homolog